MDQLRLFGGGDENRPKCVRCGGPAWWRPKHGDWSRYCTSKGCGNPNRTCQNCGQSFQVGVDGAGTKYCSASCKAIGYVAGHQPALRRLGVVCDWCGSSSTRESFPVHRSRAPWPYVCSACLEPLKLVLNRLFRHHVSPAWARKLAADPTCPGCGDNLLRWVPRGNHKEVNLTVDHDHNCCPGDTSCGGCVRGFLCYSCNTILGLAGDDATRLERLAIYLRP